MPRLCVAPLLFVVALSGCARTALRTRDVQSVTVHYSILNPDAPPSPGADPGTERKVMTIDDPVALDRLWAHLRGAGRTDRCCGCKLVNFLEVQRPGGRSETWHFCHSPTIVGVDRGEILAPEMFYHEMKRLVEDREGRTVSLICQNEEIRRGQE